MTHWAVNYIGAPYQLGASGEQGFYDCWGLVRHIQRVYFARDLPPITPDYPTALSFSKAMRDTAERQHWVLVDRPTEGDCVLLAQSKYPHHVGLWVAVDGGGVLHALEQVGVVFQSLNALTLHGWKVDGYYRHV